MKKIYKWIVLIFVCGLVACLSSNAQSTYSNKYLFGLWNAQLIDAAPDGGNYFSGRAYTGDVILGKVDSLGNLQWVKQIGRTYQSETPVGLTVLNNGNVVVLMQSDSGAFSSTIRSLVTCLDINGNHVFTKRFLNTPNNQSSPINISKDGNGFIFTIRNYNSLTFISSGIFVRLDSLGNEIGSVFIEGANLSSVFKTASNEYLIYNFINNIIIKLDSNFSYLSTTFFQVPFSSYDPGIYGIIQLTDSTFIAYGGEVSAAWACKFNSQFQTEWYNYYKLNAMNDYFGKIKTGIKAVDNSLIFLCEESNCGVSPNCNPYILRLDSLGNVLGFKMINELGFNYNGNYSKSSSKNGLFTFIYNERDTSSSYYVTAFIINRIDTAFAPLCNSIDTSFIVTPFFTTPHSFPPLNWGNTNDTLVTDSLPIIDISFPYGSCDDSTLKVKSYSNSNFNFKIFPNPATSTIQLIINTKHNVPVECEIVNVMGERVFHSTMDHGPSPIKIDVSFLPKGIYIVRVGDEESFENKKLVIE
jgi:type IX secretion system substrate protein